MATLRVRYFATAADVAWTYCTAPRYWAAVGAVLQLGVCMAWPLSVASEIEVSNVDSDVGSAGPAYFQGGSVTPRPAMPDMSIEFAGLAAFGVATNPLLDVEPGLAITMPAIPVEERVSIAAAEASGTSATEAGTTASATTPIVAQPWWLAKREARGTGAPAGSRAVGRNAIPSNTKSGPAFGSVAIPVSIPPKAWPVNQNSTPTAIPAPTKTSARRVTKGPRPMARNAVASSTLAGVPAPVKACPMESRKWAYHPGCP